MGRIRELTTKAVIDKISRIFARYGIPEEVCRNGGPQFSSWDFKEFATRCDFWHNGTSPRFSRANGLAEKGVQVVKRLLRKTECAKDDFWLGLLNYRAAPFEDGRSAAELLMQWEVRNLLPDFTVSPTSSVQKYKQSDTKERHLASPQQGDVV